MVKSHGCITKRLEKLYKLKFATNIAINRSNLAILHVYFLTFSQFWPLFSKLIKNKKNNKIKIIPIYDKTSKAKLDMSISESWLY